MRTLNVVVAGVGRLGAIHARIVSELGGGIHLAGVLDASVERAHQVADERGVPVLPGLEAVIGVADAVIVAVPTSEHHRVAGPLLDAGIPCLVEKPLARTLEEGNDLVARARRASVPLMVGHVERFNPAVSALLERGLSPRFVEAQRVSPFSFRSTDVGVVLDMMIHDIDLILHLIPSAVRSVHAVGLAVVGEHEDLANARLVFENGAVANVTASRMALKTERKIRLFAPECYVSLDLLNKKGRVLRPGDNLKQKLLDGSLDLGRLSPIEAMMRRLVKKEDIRITSKAEPLKEEDREFFAAVREGREPAVSGEHGVRAMETAAKVIDSIRENFERADLGRRDVP